MSSGMSRQPSMIVIKKTVAAQFGLRPLDMESAGRALKFARPRQVGMYLARELTTRSFPEIGMAFGGRDHTTVMHACRKIKQLQDDDQGLRDRVDLLRNMLSEGADLSADPPAQDLDAAIQTAIRHAIRQVKQSCDARFTSDADQLRTHLYQMFGEEPRFRCVDAVGRTIETLVAEDGNWSRMALHGDRATLIESGTDWMPL